MDAVVSRSILHLYIRVGLQKCAGNNMGDVCRDGLMDIFIYIYTVCVLVLPY